MNTGFPYRPPCDGWGRPIQRGGCFRHYRNSESATPVLQNVTKVANWVCPDESPGAPESIPPYPRAAQDYSNTGDTCSSYTIAPGNTGYCAAGHEPHTRPPCGGWTDEEFKRYGTFAPDLNHYVATDKTRNQALCQKIGFKNAQAAHHWYGQWGFTSTEDVTPGEVRGPGDPMPACAYSATPDQTKYLELEFRCHLKEWEPLPSRNLQELTLVAILTVDKLSGVIVAQNVSRTFVSVIDLYGTHDHVVVLEPDDPLYISQLQSWMQNVDDKWIKFAKVTCGQRHEYAGESGDTTSWNRTDIPDPAFPELTIKHTFSCGATALHYKEEDNTRTVHYYDSLAEIECYLRQPNTAFDMKQICRDLLNEVDLGDDVTYPWRTDGFVTVAPLATHSSFPGPRRPYDVLNQDVWNKWPGWYDEACFNGAPDKPKYTGAIRGTMIKGAFPAVLSNAERSDSFDSADTYAPRVPAQGNWLQLLAYPTDIISGINSVSAYLWLQDPETLEWGWSLQRTATGTQVTDYFTLNLADGIIEVKPMWLEGGNPFSTAILSADPPPADRMLLTVNYSTNPIGGGHFDRKHMTARMHQMDSGEWTNDRDYYGAWSGGSAALDPTDSAVPRNATQWTETGYSEFGLVANTLFPGSWVFMQAGSALLVMQKWAEIKLPWKSQNWFGPCGAHRDIRTGPCAGETSAECASSGTPRWPNAFPIEGDRLLAAFPTESEGTVTFRTAAPAAYLREGDQVQFTNDTLSLITDPVTITTAVGTTEFQYSGSIPTTGVTRVRSVVAGIATPPYWIYDTDGKGEFIGAFWEFDYRTRALAVEPLPEAVKTYDLYDSALKYDPCTPGVICYTPTDTEDPENTIDLFDRAIYLPWSEPSYIDESFGTRCQSMVYQIMDDIYWQPPRPVCVWNEESDPPSCDNSKCGWEEDIVNGSCTTETVVCDEADAGGYRVYPHRPMVEACFLCLDYDGATTEPSYDRPPIDRTFYGREVGWVIKDRLIADHGIDIDKLRLASDYHADDGPTFEPPEPPVTPEGHLCNDAACTPMPYDIRFTPWILFKAMQQCICSNSSFANDYKNTLGCWMCGAEPALVPDLGLTPPPAPSIPTPPPGATSDPTATDAT